MNHIGLYLSNSVNKDWIIDEIFSNKFLIKHIDLSELHGELFSPVAINRIIEEELRHDRFPIVTKENPSLLSMSAGQQRKALITHIIGMKPQYIVLDDLYSSVDNETLKFIIGNLTQLIKSTLFIQLFYRKQDVLDFVRTVYSVDGQNRIIAQQRLEQFINLHDSIHQIQNITLPNLFTETNPAINPLIQLNAVSANYGDKKVLKDICWTIQSGEFWQLKGPNGSGKSTLLSMVIGDNPRGYGEDMILFGRKKGSGETIWDIKKRIGYFTSNMTLQFTHEDSVENMIISGLVDSVGLYTKPTVMQRDIAHDWLQVLGPSFQNRKFSSLSFGQQRILLVVRAMVKHPPLLILDEPTVGLDDDNTQLFINLIVAISSQHKVSIIYVSHRTEPELNPDRIFELQPSSEGSTGHLKLTQKNYQSRG
jgi:molybdate transport system ATP-binding protein